MVQLKPTVIQIKAEFDHDSLAQIATTIEGLAKAYQSLADAATESAANVRAMIPPQPGIHEMLKDAGIGT